MTCLACGLPTALEAVRSPHTLGALLCVAHLVVALEPDNLAFPRHDGSQPRVPRDRCWGDAIACPHPVKHRTVNAGWCDHHRPPAHVPCPPVPRPADSLADDGMAAAVLAVLEGAGGTVLNTRPGYYGALDPLEGQ